MIKLYKGNILYIDKSIEEDTFKVKVVILYRYSLFKFTKIVVEEELSEKVTLKELIKTVKQQINNLDKICKL